MVQHQSPAVVEDSATARASWACVRRIAIGQEDLRQRQRAARCDLKDAVVMRATQRDDVAAVNGVIGARRDIETTGGENHDGGRRMRAATIEGDGPVAAAHRIEQPLRSAIRHLAGAVRGQRVGEPHAQQHRQRKRERTDADAALREGNGHAVVDPFEANQAVAGGEYTRDRRH